MEEEYRVHLANPAAIQQYSGLKYTDDHSDARWLAHLLRLGVLPQGYIYPKAERPVRDLLRKRAHLVRQHTANVLSVQNILARNTGARFSGKRMQELTKQELTTLLADETQVLAVTSSLVVLDCLRHQIKRLEQSVHKHLQHTPSYEQLLTVQGIGPILAQTITLETGAISRFPSVGNYASYCRCVDSTKISNGKRKGTGNVKNGNPYLAWAYMEAAQFALRFYQRKLAKSRNNTVLARKAVAHKLSRAMSKMATRIWPGRIWRPRNLPCAFNQKRSAFTNASWPRAATTRSWHGKLWPISCHGLAMTSCETLCLLRRRERLADSCSKAGLRLEARGKVGC
jgi:transposase